MSQSESRHSHCYVGHSYPFAQVIKKQLISLYCIVIGKSFIQKSAPDNVAKVAARRREHLRVTERDWRTASVLATPGSISQWNALVGSGLALPLPLLKSMGDGNHSQPRPYASPPRRAAKKQTALRQNKRVAIRWLRVAGLICQTNQLKILRRAFMSV